MAKQLKCTLLSILKSKIELDTEGSGLDEPTVQNPDTLNNESSDPSSGHSGDLYPCIDFKMVTSQGNYVGNCLSPDYINGMNFCYMMKNGSYCPEGTKPSSTFPDKCVNYDVCQKLAKMNTTVGSLEDTNQNGQYRGIRAFNTGPGRGQ